MEEQEYEEILTYLLKGKYPEKFRRRDMRSNWRKKCRPFTLSKNKLVYNHKKYGALQVVKGIKAKQRVIEASHVQEDGRHYGINRTLKKVSTNYYWKTIAKDVHQYVKGECQTCIEQVLQQSSAVRQAMVEREGEIKVRPNQKIVDKAVEQIGIQVIGNILRQSVASPPEPGCSVLKCENVPQPPMQPPVLPRDQIMAQCGLDVIGPLSETHKGKKYVAVLTDCVTKWVEATALSEFTTESLGNFLAETICRHGAIEVMTKHNSNDFCARLTERMHTIMGLTVHVSRLLPSESQPNGYLEHRWYNTLFCGAFLKYSNQNQYYWDVNLQQAILAYRTFHQKNFPGSPFQLLYDRPTRLPVLGVSQSSNDSYTDEQEALIEHMTNYVKALSPTQPQPLIIHSQPNERLTPPFITADKQPLVINSQSSGGMTPSYITPDKPLIIHNQSNGRMTPPYITADNLHLSSASPSTSLPTSQQEQSQQNTQVIGPFTSTVQANNQIHSSLPLTTLGTSLPQNSQASATIYTIPSNGITANTIAAQALSMNNLNTQNVQANTSTITAHTIQNNSITTHNIPNTSHIITAPTITQVARDATSAQASVSHTSTVQTATNITSQATTEAHSGHMVMIHTDGKAYADSFYVICPQ